MKVLKFGGTSMANASSIKLVAEIVKSNADNKFVVVSAPGKREKTDTKVTDLLYACYNEKQEKGICEGAIKVVKERFKEIIKGLDLSLDLKQHFDIIKNEINEGASKDYVASRGEYLSAIVMAAYLGWEFIDTKDVIKFDAFGAFDSELTNKLCEKRLSKCDGAVIPGFYGAMPNGLIKTFSRGGSDVSGAIIARAAKAEIYENWTDVDGFMTCDPRIAENPSIIEMLTYKELRELSYMGANVLHPDSIFPVRKNNIPINIKNTFNPTAKGTLIVPTKLFLKGDFNRKSSTITGIAGKKDFFAIYIEKSMMNNELGFMRKVLEVVEKNGVSVEHMPSGIDTMTVVAERLDVSDDVLASIVDDIVKAVHPDNIEIVNDIALIAVVGHGMSKKKGTATKVTSALYKADVNIRMIDQGSSELNIIIGVENADYENAIRALYNEFKS